MTFHLPLRRTGFCLLGTEHPLTGQPPGHLKNHSNARPYEQFLLANAPPPVPSVVVKCLALQSSRSIYKIISYRHFNKHNCFSSIELHKIGHEMSHSDWKKTKQMVLLLYRSFMVDKCSSPTPKWQCLTAWNPWLRAPSEMTTGCYETSFCCCLQMPGRTLLTAKCPAPGTHRKTNARGLPGGMQAVGIDSQIWIIAAQCPSWQRFINISRFFGDNLGRNVMGGGGKIC